MLTFKSIIEREGLTPKQAQRARSGLRWARRFGLLKVERPWQRYVFEESDLRTALILSIIIEAAKREKSDECFGDRESRT